RAARGRGRAVLPTASSTPAMRATPVLRTRGELALALLVAGFAGQMIRTVPLRSMTLHLSQAFAPGRRRWLGRPAARPSRARRHGFDAEADDLARSGLAGRRGGRPGALHGGDAPAPHRTEERRERQQLDGRGPPEQRARPSEAVV